MDPLTIHLLLNHLPAVGGTVALLLLGWGLVRRSTDVTAVALVGFVIVAVLSVPVFVTGWDAARLIGADERQTEAHRDAAIAAMIGVLAAASAAGATLYAGRHRTNVPYFPAIATLLLGLAAAVLLIRTAHLGGQVRHADDRARHAVVDVDR